MKTLKDFDFKDKAVLLRADLNSDVKDGKLILGERIKQSVLTIKELKKKRARVVVIAHQGQEGKDDFISLEQHAKALSKYTKIGFVRDIIGKKATDAIKKLKPGDALLLENIRFEKDELSPYKKDNKLLETLASLFDIYVNDAFSVCHRENTSIVGFPKRLPGCAGLLLEKEMKALKRINIKNCLYILGGAKSKDYLLLLRGQKTLACGLFAQSMLVSKGVDMGAQNRYLEREADLTQDLKKQLLERQKNIILPEDFAVKINGKRVELPLEKFPSEHEIFDIGQKTLEKYVKIIEKAKAIYMKGPAGDFESKGFEKGTFGLLKAVAKNKGFSLIGGGSISDAIEKSRISKRKFSHISLSGGALLRYLAGEKLAGLEALGNIY